MSFTRVSKKSPCPVCKKPDWCRVFADGWVECMRVQSDKPAKSGGWMWGPSRESTPHWGHTSSGLRPPSPQSGEGGRTPTINATKLIREWQVATPATALVEFATSLGVSTSALAAVGAAWAEPHAAWAFPMCDGYGNIVGIRLRNERGKFAVRGSKQGVFTTTDHGPQTTAPQKTLFVCEGPTDTAAAVELGLFAVGRPNCCCGGADIKVLARRHDVSRVVIISDNDKPGLDGARKVGAEVRLPFAIYVPPAKDLREFVQLGGTRAMIENTVNKTVWHT